MGESDRADVASNVKLKSSACYATAKREGAKEANVSSEPTERETGSSQHQPSARLRLYVSTVASERIALGDIVRTLGNSTPGFMLLVLALPAFVPTGLPIAAPAGAAMMVIGALMMAGRTEITMPPWFARRSLTRAQIGSLVKAAVPVIEWLERPLMPRLAWVLKRRQLRIAGIMVAVNGLLIFLPIPFGNSIPAIAVIFMALGMMAGDGAAVISGIALSIVAILIAIVAVTLSFEFIMVLIT